MNQASASLGDLGQTDRLNKFYRPTLPKVTILQNLQSGVVKKINNPTPNPRPQKTFFAGLLVLPT
jgi:hypothetical protein